MDARASIIIPLVIAALSWIVTHTVDRLLSQPVLMYELSEVPMSNKDYRSCLDSSFAPEGLSVIQYRIENLSTNQLFNKIDITAKVKTGEVRGVRVAAIAPAVITGKQEGCQNYAAFFRNLHIQPRGRFHLEAAVTPGTELELLLQSTDQPIRLMEKNLDTFFVKNEITLFMIIGVLLVVYLVVVLFYKYRQKEDSN